MSSRFGAARRALLSYEYLTKEQIRNSPSRRDGISEAAERLRLNKAACAILEVAKNWKWEPKLTITTPATAVVYLRRFFSRRSLKHNDCFVIAAACMFLACKACDEPFPHMHVAIELYRQWYGREREDVRSALSDPAYAARLSTAVLDAERAVLFTIGFDFKVPLLHTEVVLLVLSPRFSYLKDNSGFLGSAVACCTDLLKRDAGIVLEYPAREVAMAIFYFVFKCIKLQRKHNPDLVVGYGPPPPEPNGRLWYINEGMLPERMLELNERVTARYQAPQTAASTLSKPAGGEAAAAAAAADSAAGGEAATAAGSAAGQAGSPVESTAEAPLGVGKRKAPDEAAEAASGHDASAAEPKRARAEAPPPSAAPPPAVLRPPAVARPPAAVPPPAVARPLAVVPPPAVAPTAAESEPEEGELEEGELPG